MRQQLSGILLLSTATMIWGAGFIGTRWTLEAYSPTWSNTIRFLLCLPIALIYLYFKKSFYKGKVFFKGGAILGLLLFLGLWSQTIGISQTTVAKSGFFTTFYSFFTPFFSIYFFKRKLHWKYWALVALALIGMAFLCELKIENFNRGDVFILLSSIAFSLHIIATERFAATTDDALELNLIQTLFMAIFALSSALWLEGIPDFSPLFQFQEIGTASPISGFIILSFFSTLIAFSIQVMAQKKIPSQIASLVFLMESLFAALFGYIFLEETLSHLALAGAGIVLIAVSLIPFTSRPSNQ